VSSVAGLHQQHGHTAALGQWCTNVNSMVADGASFGTMVHQSPFDGGRWCIIWDNGAHGMDGGCERSKNEISQAVMGLKMRRGRTSSPRARIY